jgi:hypothetical protein
MVTISSIRYRLPIEPFLIIFASSFIIKLLKKGEIQYGKKTAERSEGCQSWKKDAVLGKTTPTK